MLALFALSVRGGLTLAGCQVPTKLLYPSINRTGGEKHDGKLVGQDKGREITASYCHRQNRLDLGKLM